MNRKYIFAALLIVVLGISIWAPAFAAEAPAFLLDEANLLSPSEETLLRAKLERLSSSYDVQISIVTANSTEGMSVGYYVEYLYDSMGYGYGESHDGILLLVAMDVREFRILTNGAANDAIGSYEIDIISDAIVYDLSDGYYAAAFDTFADECAYYLEGHINGYPFDWGQNLLTALVIGLVAGLITAFVLKGQLKSVRRQNQADAYVRCGSMQLTTRSDLFLYRHVSRTRKETNNGSRSGSRSGGRSVGGRSF